MYEKQNIIFVNPELEEEGLYRVGAPLHVQDHPIPSNVTRSHDRLGFFSFPFFFPFPTPLGYVRILCRLLGKWGVT